MEARKGKARLRYCDHRRHYRDYQFTNFPKSPSIKPIFMTTMLDVMTTVPLTCKRVPRPSSMSRPWTWSVATTNALTWAKTKIDDSVSWLWILNVVTTSNKLEQDFPNSHPSVMTMAFITTQFTKGNKWKIGSTNLYCYF